MRLVWTARARARLRQIHGYIAREDHPLNAERVVERITRRVEPLLEHPRLGRVVERYQREDIRELIESPYRIIYLIADDRIDILTVRDTRRLLPRRLDEL
ncbi:type II toxin-antitoxin system RelE/ParE family toxin [Natronospira bacteriovora]|uniref:Type II toxin-antitoxin system RelE/ParE family toxin n=1 Tax=Natronospira bacteriovora TaxID=3069753 RepID=A0ABU0WA38_9GAMM|nr:type II toxin-antitoxin system RelE/ParE family toxin [Natronospira sp. AB-CW4]MDQ2070769.1 type II toxin-antitoxin system RelE/ParE family toxin [Natronospira sp. AB-CW4]